MKQIVLALILILINAQIARSQVLYGSYTERAFGEFIKPSMKAYIALIDDQAPQNNGVNNVHIIYVVKIDTSKLDIPNLEYSIVNANYNFIAYKNLTDLKFCKKEDNNLWILAFPPDIDSGYIKSFSFFGEKYKPDSIYKYADYTLPVPKYYYDGIILFYSRQNYNSQINVYFNRLDIPDYKYDKSILLKAKQYFESPYR
jgi:hypothetical protein